MSAEDGVRKAELLRFESADELAAAAANEFLQQVVAHGDEPFCLALSGGRITLRFFSAVLERSKARNISLTHVEFFWADERCVPPQDPESNFAAADKFFFQPLHVPPEKIHRIRGEESPEFAAQQAEAEICRIAPLNDDGLPILDLTFLGMGEDGHVASLFPGEPAEVTSGKCVYRAISNSPKPPLNRVTLCYSAIAAAKNIWVLASGDGKADSLRESLRPSGSTPLARVLRLHPNTKIFTDILVS